MLSLLLLVAQSWVVRDVIPPIPSTAGSELGFGSGVACGDLDGDDCVESYAHGFEWPFAEDLVGFFHGGPKNETLILGSPPFRFIPGASGVPRIALLRTPHGLILAYLDLQNGGHLQTRRFPELKQSVAVSASLQPGAFVRAGDVNGDGWEELFCQDYDNSAGYALLVDGRTLSVIWQRRFPSSRYPSMLTRNTAHTFEDLDGDLIPDCVAVWTNFDLITGLWDHSVQAFSGLSGAMLWENRASTSVGNLLSAVTEHDLTHDGKDDVILANGSVIKMISGSDGATVWSFDPTSILQAAGPPGWTYLQPLNPALLTWDPSASAMRLVLPIKYWQVQVNSVFRVELAHFDPYTGAFLNFATLPDDIEPWFSDTFQNSRGDSPIFALGDMDRDGLQEIGIGVPAPAYDVIFNGLIPRHLVTLGLRTLEIPAQLPIGMAAPVRVSIPSAILHDFYLVGSRSFDRRGGVRFEGWRTHLADDPWLTWSTASRAFSGTLNAVGVGQTLITVPNHAALIGSTLYTRAVVLAPGGQEIWTLSTLGISEIVP